jgi:isopenicillin N synthase-like dioxygenase
MIPVIDLGPYLAARRGADAAAAAEIGRALTDVGFFVVVNHGIPQALIDDTFAEARRFHAQPMDAKLALRMNEHNNGYMMLGRYAVWTSDVNANDKPDLNEAFFVKRERGPDDPLVRAKRRFAGPNQWPAALPGFRETVIAYTDTVDALGRKLMPLCATALDLPPDTFDSAFAESQFSFRLTHYPPAAAEANQFGIAPHTDDLPRPERDTWAPGAHAGGDVGRRAVRARLVRGELGRHDAALDKSPLQVHAAPGAAAGGPPALRNPLLHGAASGHQDRVSPDLPGPR